MNNLKLYRKKLGKSQKDIADYLGMTQAAYGNYELGKRQIGVEILSKLSDYYGVSIDDLVGRNDIGKQVEEQPEIIPEEEYMIPLVASLRCGPGDSAEPFTYIKPVPVPVSYKKRWGDGLQAIIAVGESMSPNIIPGDMLICRPGDEWVDGNVVSVNYEDTDMIKRIYATADGIDLKSDNPSFATIHVSADDIQTGRFHVLGRVLIPIGKEL